MSDYKELLGSCNESGGCFASDRKAFEAMFFGGDSGIREQLKRIADAAFLAGASNQKLESAIFEPVVIEVAGQSGGWVDLQLGKDDPTTIGGIIDEGSGNMFDERVAKCAFECGAAADDCPIKSQTEDS